MTRERTESRDRPGNGATSALEQLRPGLSMQVPQRGEAVSVTLSGTALDEAPLARLRRLLVTAD